MADPWLSLPAAGAAVPRRVSPLPRGLKFEGSETFRKSKPLPSWKSCQKPAKAPDPFQPHGPSPFWPSILLSHHHPPSFPASQFPRTGRQPWCWGTRTPSLTSRSPQEIPLPLGSHLLHPPGTPPNLTSSPLADATAPQTAPARGCYRRSAFPVLSRSEPCRKLHGLRVPGDGRGAEGRQIWVGFLFFKTAGTILRFYLRWKLEIGTCWANPKGKGTQRGTDISTMTGRGVTHCSPSCPCHFGDSQHL